jgi:uncharacterized protein GlcG (DUF336 family)
MLANNRPVFGVRWVSFVSMVAFVCVATAAPGDAPQPGGSASDAKTPLSIKDISLTQAQAVIAAAVKKAEELHINEDIAVVDVGGSLKAFVRMDNAWLGSIDIAIKKAKTSRFFEMPSGDIGKQAQPGGPLYHIEFSNGGLITFPGGRPLHESGSDAPLGAIGASGSTVENDDAVAQAGAAALK